MKKICQWRRNFAGFLPRKVLLAMRLSLGMFLIISCQAVASVSYSQDTKVSVRMKRAQVKEVLRAIEQSSGFYFVYNNELVNVERIVNVDAENQKIKDVLEDLFREDGVGFTVMGRQIVLTPSEMMVDRSGQPQKKTVLGTVSDSKGEPIPGATITIKGTTNGTITDMNGNFSLSLPETAEVLVFSFIGMQTQEVEIGDNLRLDIVMQEDVVGLEEVVVVGYGTMKKSDLTGAVISANIDDLKESPNTNAVQLLQGTVPGLNVGQVTSAGSTPSFSVRGTNTLSGNSNVLIVLDGIIYNSSLSSINPNDIESIDVLKDASATAVYGAQAANGVIHITTKKGSEGKTSISFSSSYSMQEPTKNLRPMNREEYLSFVKEFYYDKAYQGPDYTTPNPEFDLAASLPDAVMRDSEQSDGISPYDYNWWDEGTRTGSIWENKLSVSGGNKVASYLLSFGHTDQKNYILNDDFKRNSIRVNLDATPVNWWKIGIQSFGSFVNQDGAEPNFWSLRTQSPLITPYDENGELEPYPFNTLDTNPFMGSEVDDQERHNYFFANIYSEISLPLKGLTYRINFGNNYRIDEHFYASKYGAGLTGSAYKHHTSYYDYTLDNILSYNGNFGDHSLNATFVYGAIERKYNYTNSNSDDFSRMTLGYNSLELGTNQYANSDAWEEALLYQMFRANYKYKEKYLFTATLRRDGFSGFAENNKTALFPSVALGWVVTNENFMDVPWLNYLKLRGGYGVSGNLTSRYKSLAQVVTQAGYVFGDGGSTEISQKLASMQNDDLKWEKTKGVNAGFDYGLFGNRINGSFEIYQTTTHDLLYDVALPTITGFSSISSNVGEIRNQGIEFMVTSRNIERKNFKWTTTFNISSNSNKIITLLGADNDGDGIEDDLISSNLFIGEPISAVYGYIIDGIYQVDDDIPAGFNPGNYKIRDVTEDGEITTDDRVILGKRDPAYRFGVMNKFKFHNVSFSFFVNSVQGGKDGYLGSNSMALYRNDNNLRWNLISEQAADLWSPNNRDATYSRSITAGKIVPTSYQQRSFIRLQDVTLAYALPSSFLAPYGIKDLNIYLNGKNLITLTDWKGWDPEADSNYGGRPVMKSVTLGLNVTF
ncbi:TonB-dependent receptor [Thermophagus sp. OGC60D27]|uniref:TonB-dependent receptor n=1 Tax=Thermophagus sp. OGC60D27 TaxID=3458415 RepID=UPI00403840CF